MLHAVEAPLLKMAAVAGAALLVGLYAGKPEPVTQHLRLHAPVRPHAVYATQWNQGDISVTLEDGKPHTMVFHKTERAWGCSWTSTETLVPDGPGRYWYSYDEVQFDCDPCAPPSITTPRVGFVEVVP